MSGLLDDMLPQPEPSGPGLFGDAAPAPAPGPGPAPAAPAEAGPALAPPTPYRVLARKYRPTHFGDLIGQEAMVRILRNAFAQGRIAHAWMLTGVRGVGKTTTARIIARALNCTGPDGQGGPTADPCGVCPNCLGILADRHPDVTEMDAASRTGVDDVRELIEAAQYRPLQARSKVFIVDEVHMLSRNAFNALLKTLEEPPAHVKFIFATTEIRKVPVTVLSRCQRFDLRRVPVAELTGLFGRIAAKEGIAVDPAALDLIARAADGSARDGLSLLDQAIAQGAGQEGPIQPDAVADMLGLADRSAIFALMAAVLDGKPEQALAITDAAHLRGADLGVMLGDLLDLTHTLTRLKTVPGLRDGTDLPEMERDAGTVLADRLSLPVLGRLWQMLLKGVAEVEHAPDRRAAAEMVLIRLCYVADLPPPGELVRRLTEAGSASAPRSAPPDGGGVRAVANGAPMLQAAPQVLEAAPQVLEAAPRVLQAAPQITPQTTPQITPETGPVLASFRDVAALVEQQKQALLHSHLLHAVHLVRFAPPVIELRPDAKAPRNLAGDLAKLLQDATGTRWTIALSQAPGEPTLAEQGQAAGQARQDAAAEHPLVRAILDAFPGARLGRVSDSRADAYGLLAEPDGPDFAPLDAVPVEEMEED